MARLTRVSEYLPTVTMWNRLEGRPRTVNFDRALKAEVADALWMISKQWQMGEFIGDDAGSPVLAKALLETTRLAKYQAGSEPAEALEAVVHGPEDRSRVVGRSIDELDLPAGAVIVALVRNERVIIAHHDTKIEPEDHVIMFLSDRRQIDAVQRLFAPD